MSYYRNITYKSYIATLKQMEKLETWLLPSSGPHDQVFAGPDMSQSHVGHILPWKDPPFLMGKSTMSTGPFSMAKC